MQRAKYKIFVSDFDSKFQVCRINKKDPHLTDWVVLAEADDITNAEGWLQQYVATHPVYYYDENGSKITCEENDT